MPSRGSLVLSLLLALAPASATGLARKPIAKADPANTMPAVSFDRLMDAQSALVDKQIAALQPRLAQQPNVYALAVAASGRQSLFSREAHLALQVVQARFGAEYRGGVLLSNGAPDILHTPLSTRGTMVQAMGGLARTADRGEDVVFVYLASHGGADASLETDLPDLEPIRAISATSLAEALMTSGIRHRVIVISACFAGSWIPALANDDTIIIAAARYDRTSFGCDDRRRLTYFGQAFLEGPLAQGASLREAFEAARTQVGKWEAAQKCLPSEPQVYIGANMTGLWQAESPARRSPYKP